MVKRKTNLTYCGKDGSGIIERSGKLPWLAGLVRLLQLHNLLQDVEVVVADFVLAQHLVFEVCKKGK